MIHGHLSYTANSTTLTDTTERDEQLLAMWLFDRPEETRRAYAADVRGFLVHTGKAIQATTLGDVQGFVAGLSSFDAGGELAGLD